MTRPIPADLLRQKLIQTLADTRTSLTTAQLRQLLDHCFDYPVVNETVYRNLVALERRGQVQRCEGPRRGVHWKHVDHNTFR
jgi:hypothetical protein